MPLFLKLRPGAGPRYGQIRDGIRSRISEGALTPRERLPAVRELSRQLGLNHQTVLRAYRELETMGYVDLEVGRGTFVCRRLPEPFLGVRPAAPAPPRVPSRRPLAPLPTAMRDLPFPAYTPFWQRARPALADFTPKIGDVRRFPTTSWRRILLRRLRKGGSDAFRYGSAWGHADLIEALREHILPARGIRAEPREIVIFPGGMQAIQACLDLTLRQGDRVLLEDPCARGFHTSALLRGCRPVPVPVDAAGIDPGGLGKAVTRHPARALILTPSHQYPTGATLDYGRRKGILALLARRPLWILEDDYENEFHYDSIPLPSLKSMDPSGQVLYCGTFSKVLSPGIAVGFAVAEPRAAAALAQRKQLKDVRMPALLQQVLADFIREGCYDTHVRRMRRIYQRRRDALAEALHARLPDFRFRLPAGGMRLWVEAPPDVDVSSLAAHAAKRGVLLRPARTFVRSRSQPPDRYLFLGFAYPDESEIRGGVLALKRILEAGLARLPRGRPAR